MTQEEKQLLLVDLSARLPYNVKGTWYNSERISILSPSDIDMFNIEDFKPYLRPMSSMDSEEIETYRAIIGSLLENSVTYNVPTLYNFLNSKHLDYRGLIERGLALEAPEGMYKL